MGNRQGEILQIVEACSTDDNLPETGLLAQWNRTGEDLNR
jgi:hypothetical protein